MRCHHCGSLHEVTSRANENRAWDILSWHRCHGHVGQVHINAARAPEQRAQAFLLEFCPHLGRYLRWWQVVGAHSVNAHETVAVPNLQLWRPACIPEGKNRALDNLVDNKPVRLLEDVLVPLDAPLIVSATRGTHAHAHTLGSSAFLVAGLCGFHPALGWVCWRFRGQRAACCYGFAEYLCCLHDLCGCWIDTDITRAVRRRGVIAEKDLGRQQLTFRGVSANAQHMSDTMFSPQA
mmetsp:Transcript_1289/g.4259  ORF Transcript_1289/g.4259 Transcript_1289/m.4259 type:complete len:236 (-) Transcript_1289:128-835(-)